MVRVRVPLLFSESCIPGCLYISLPAFALLGWRNKVCLVSSCKWLSTSETAGVPCPVGSCSRVNLTLLNHSLPDAVSPLKLLNDSECLFFIAVILEKWLVILRASVLRALEELIFSVWIFFFVSSQTFPSFQKLRVQNHQALEIQYLFSVWVDGEPLNPV